MKNIYIVIAGLFTFCSTISYGQLPGNPNIIYILTDDLGYGDVRINNPEGRIPTPNIDQLSLGGMRFTDAHSSSSVCTPSRYSILTGRYPWRSRLQKGIVMGYDHALIDSSHLTVGGFLQQQGYYSACIGKWHLGWNWTLKPGYAAVNTGWEVDYTKPFRQGPQERGFDYFYGIPVTLDAPPYIFVENNRTIGIPSVTKKFGGRSGPAEKDFEAVNGVPVLTRKAQEFLISRANSSQPFFLYFSIPAPHTPIVPDSNFIGKSGVTKYGDWVMETDWSVGQVLNTLDSLGMSENTIVVFTSDNGFAPYVLSSLGYDVEKLGHYPSYVFRGYKSDIWDGGHRVPFIVRWPAKIRPGSVSNDLISLTDFMATCADILNAKMPGDAAEDSYSILPALLEKKGRSERPAVVSQSIQGYFTIRQGKWKLAFCPGSGGWTSPGNGKAYKEGFPLVQLYNMRSDFSEKNNVESKHPRIVKRLTGLMERYVEKGRSTPGVPLKNDAVVDIWKKDYMQ